MSIGLGKKYFVHVVKHHFGDLPTCIDFMRENDYRSEHYWFELRPEIRVVNGHAISTGFYSCDLVEDGSLCKK